MNQKVLALLLAAGVMVSCSGKAENPSITPAQEYPGVWMPATPEVYRTIYQSGGRCSEGYQKGSVERLDKFLVYCRDINGVWTAFFAWTGTNRAEGPSYLLADGVEMPERSEEATAIVPN